MLPPFELLEPSSLAEALETLAGEPGVTPLAGGTNLFPDLRAGRTANGRLVSLAKLDGLRYIARSDEGIIMGAGTTVTDLLRHPEIGAAAPSLVASAEVFGGYMVRNAATVGGNLAYGSPAADLVPPLLCLDAEVTLASAQGERVVPLDEFLVDYRKTVMRPDELMTAITWAPRSAPVTDLIYKLGRRKGDAITVVGVAVALAVDDGRCSLARIALASVAPTVFRAKQGEDVLMGQALTPDLIDEAARRAAEASSPIDDLRASADYRRHAAHVLVRRLLTQAWERVA